MAVVDFARLFGRSRYVTEKKILKQNDHLGTWHVYCRNTKARVAVSII